MERTYSTTSDADRLRVVKAYLEGQRGESISDIMKLKRSTVDSIIKVYLTEGRTTALRRGGEQTKKLTDEHLVALREWIDDDCSISLIKLVAVLKRRFGIVVSKTTVDRALVGFSYTVKRVYVQPERRNDAEAINDRYRYACEFLYLVSVVPEECIIFLDELGFNVSMRTRRGRSLRGTRAIQVVPSLRSRNISICCAMSSKQIIYYKAQSKPFNGVFFSEFLVKLFAILEERGVTNAVLVMDNVPFHKSEIIRELIDEMDTFHYFFLHILHF